MAKHKTLTDADLGLSETSNQTHIGLSQSMVRTGTKEDRQIQILFYTPDLGAEIACAGIASFIERENGAINAPKLKSAGGEFVIGDALNAYSLIRHFATKGSRPRELWMEELDDVTYRVQLLPSTATEMVSPSTPPTPPTPPTAAAPVGTLNELSESLCRVKPFIILAGPSGTGKSRWVRQQAYLTHQPTAAERLAGEAPPNYQLISVKPNWHDSSELLGYVTRLGMQPGQSARFVVTDFVRFLIRAWRNPNIPHWLCLDEMNLAPVEQYFAEFLSVIETRRVHDGKVTTDAILSAQLLSLLTTSVDWDLFCSDAGLMGADQSLIDDIRGSGLRIPRNLVVVGTVNMDETTHSFSRKVLDRAFVWEMPIGNLSSSWEPLGYPSAAAIWTPLSLTSGAEAVAVLGGASDARVTALLDWLTKFNIALADTPFEVSYRVRDELLLLAAARGVQPPADILRVLDDGLYAKVLPRIEGDAERVQRPLVMLGSLLAEAAQLSEWSSALTASGEGDRALMRSLDVGESFLFGATSTTSTGPFAAVLPWRRSLRKIRSMLLRLDGHFSSYWE